MMTENFQTDEAMSTDADFAADDNKYGNTERGDGSFYRRRGYFGLRGRTMYQRLQKLRPQLQVLTNPESAAFVQNSAIISSDIWKNPNLLNETALTPYADGTFWGFSMLWYKLNADMKQLSSATKYYSKFLRQLGCGGDLYPGQGPSCVYNKTHNGSCSADCIIGLEDSGAYCGCSGERGPQCTNSPKHIRCCADTCAQELKMDLGFVLDASGSVGIENYRFQQTFTKDLLRRVNVGRQKTHVGIINYSDQFETLSWLNEDYELNEKLRRVDDATYFGSGTDTAQALSQANIVFSYEKGRRRPEEGATPVIFLITDGESNNRSATIQAANVLKQNEIILVSVGVGSGPNLVELHAVCTPPASENYFAISNYQAFDKKLNQFTSKSCSEPATISSNTTITIEISKNKYKFLKVEFVTVGNKILITAWLSNGNVKLFYSFTTRNPRDPAEFIDYEASTRDSSLLRGMQLKSYFYQTIKGRNIAKDRRVTLVIDKPDSEVDFVYLGVKGVEEDNTFELTVEDCNKVTCKSNALIIQRSLLLIVLFGFFLR
ncbi:unnamed protein product [Rotaria sp. Silwood1]|nr:unnamed protein product [Rotaria sp. Silwood1]